MQRIALDDLKRGPELDAIIAATRRTSGGCNRTRVFDALPGKTAEIAARLNLAPEAVKWALSDLHAKGRISRGPGKPATWLRVDECATTHIPGSQASRLTDEAVGAMLPTDKDTVMRAFECGDTAALGALNRLVRKGLARRTWRVAMGFRRGWYERVEVGT